MRLRVNAGGAMNSLANQAGIPREFIKEYLLTAQETINNGPDTDHGSSRLGEASMTRGENERMAVLETKMGAMVEQSEALHAKLDTIISGQQAGAQDRADLRNGLLKMQASIDEMKPHVSTVANAKIFWGWSGRVAAYATAAGAAGWAAWENLRQIASFIVGKHP